MTSSSNRIYFSRKFKAFTVNGMARRGVHPTIRKLFFPLYSYERATLGPFTASREQGSVKETRCKPGVRAGLLVDTELKRTVNLFVKYKIPIQAFSDHSKLVSYADKIKEQLTIKDHQLLKKKLSSAVSKIWQTCLKLNLSPEECQVGVGCASLKVATAVDLVCTDVHNRKVIIEIKTGFMHYYHRHTSTHMNVLTPKTTDSPYHQHMLQLLLTYQLYRTTFPSSKMGGAYVMRVDAVGVDILPLCDAVKSNAAKIFAAVRASC